MPGTQELGLYGVLGPYDFNSMVEADDNEAVAQFSLEFGVRAGAHVTTLPAVLIGHLQPPREPTAAEVEEGLAIHPDR